MRKSSLILLSFSLLALAAGLLRAQTEQDNGPTVLVLYDGPDIASNPGRLDALYLINLLGHFTTRRKVHSLDTYQPGEWKDYDAVFSIVYQRKYRVPGVFLEDIAQDPKTFCWLGNQPAQLDRVGLLRKHGLAFEFFTDQNKVHQVVYKGKTIAKGDPETNFLRVIDPDAVKVLATALVPGGAAYPYAMQSGNFWLFADSPFSYSSENDRYLVLADLLHDILGVQHAENHPAILRIEDINAMSNPSDLQATLRVIRRHHIPFAFGYVPMYVNPQDRLEFRMADKPDVVSALQNYLGAGGVPVLHGYTHQYRGVTTDDYEFWDDLSDRPVRGDSESFATRRISEAIKESMGIGINPVTWETPHYAASPIDYRVMHRFFDTVFERRLAGPSLDSDQLFPYPVIDAYGQYVIPEDLAYIPIDDRRAEPVLEAADSASVVRDGYASFFFHPFLDPNLLEQLISGVQQRGFHFIDIRSFPNAVHSSGRMVTTQNGAVHIGGHGHYLNEYVYGSMNQEYTSRAVEVDPQALVKRDVSLGPNQTYVALRQDIPAPGFLKKILLLAKGDISIWQRKLESVVSQQSERNPVRSIILWNNHAKGQEAVDQKSFFSAFTSLGFDMDRVDYDHVMGEDLGPFNLLVIPSASARQLTPQVMDRLDDALNGGLTIITDGESPLSQALGIQLGERTPVSVLQDHLFVNQETRWPDRPSVPWVSSPRADNVTVIYSDRDTQHPLVVSGKQREGRYLFFAPLFDDLTGQGYGRFPNLPQLLLNELRITPIATRMGADVYFDPGYQTASIEVLARMWRRFGIRAVHVGGWAFYNTWHYDYDRLIHVAHQNGILVYAWFEWPEVSQRFWEQHPAWREKTAMLTDAHVDWRYLMDLQDPQCMKAVLSDVDALMRNKEWDGVDIGELTFESLEGPDQPQTFTPFNSHTRREFKTLHQFDPVELFDDDSPHNWQTSPDDLKLFYQYRRDVNNRLLRTFLDHLRKLESKEKKQWDIVVTMLDALQHPKLSDYLAIDVNRTVDLVNQYNATLQAEDPADDWSKPPDRYLKLGALYKDLPLKNQYMIDINVLPSIHPETQKGFATSQPTGVELVQLWRAASSQTDRVCFYSVSSIHEQDWEIMPFAMAAQARVQREGENWIVNAPSTIRLDVGRDTRGYILDGQPWFCAEKGSVLVPAGQHTLQFTRTPHPLFDASQLETHLISISGELLGSQRVRRGLDIQYDSPDRCAMLLNKLPYKMYIDDEPAHLPSIRGDDGYTVLAPPGRHRLRVLTETVGLYAVEFTSLVSASLIVLFGLASSGLLGILFLLVIAGRYFRRLQGREEPAEGLPPV